MKAAKRAPRPHGAMTPVYLKDGRWQVRVPRKLSEKGKRESRYFVSKSKAEAFIKDFRVEHREHGRSVVTAADREWIATVKRELGDINTLRQVLDHWHRTGAKVASSNVTHGVTNRVICLQM